MIPEHDSSPARRWGARSDWIAAVAVVALWLLSRPYRGVRHDALLYLGEALSRLMPERFATDLFLRSPVQDRFSVFSPLLAPLLARFGIGPVELVMLAACHLLFLLGVWKLTEDWTPRSLRWGMLAFAAVMPHTYGGLGEFGYAEPFLTARSVAEPLALLALWQLVRGRVVTAIVLAAGAAAFHPLIVFPVLIVGWVMLVVRRRSWAWLGVALAVCPLLAVAGVPPFPGLLHAFDPRWLEIVRAVNPQVFAASYTRLDLAPFVFDALVLALLLRSSRTPATTVQLAKATLLSAAALTTVWVVGADLFHNVLLTQLQLWRIQWPLHLLASTMLPCVLLDCWGRGWAGRWLAAAVGLAGVAVGSNWNTGWACVAWALAALAVEHWRLQMSDRAAKGAALASCAGMLVISAEVAHRTMMAIRAQPDIVRDTGVLMVLAGLPLVAGLLVLAFHRLLTAGHRMEVVAAIVAVVGVVAGTRTWDQRSDWQRRAEARLEVGAPVFDAQIPAGATVFWDDELLVPWLLGLRGEFYAQAQGSGVVFDRALALELARRVGMLSRLDAQRELCHKLHASAGVVDGAAANCPASAQLLADVCHSAGHPDYLVLGEPTSTLPLAQWSDLDPRNSRRGRSYHLYSCAQFP
jgi:hypothetical protein